MMRFLLAALALLAALLALAAHANIITLSAVSSGAQPVEETPAEGQSDCAGQTITDYIRDGGTGDGDAWNDALDVLPASLVRGGYYYVADGSYASYTFDDDNSSTTRITICKATVSEHGTETGWLDTYGDGQAAWGTIRFTDGYYTFDGTTGGGPGSWETGFGFTVTGLDPVDVNDTFGCCSGDGIVDGITIRHVDIDATSVGNEENTGIYLDLADNALIEYVFLHDIGCDAVKLVGTNGLTFQYSKVARNYQAEPGCHGDLFEWPAVGGGTATIRWNYFEDVVGSYLFGKHEDPAVSGYDVYGNIVHFKNDDPNTGNGTLGLLSGNTANMTGVTFCNNTIAGRFSSVIGVNNVGGDLSGVLRSNLWYEGTDNGYSFGYGGLTQSHNSHYNMASVAGTGNENPTGNPFTNLASNDLSLTSASTAGDATGCPAGNSVDMFGVTRGADGTYDRGAVEFVE